MNDIIDKNIELEKNEYGNLDVINAIVITGKSFFDRLKKIKKVSEDKIGQEKQAQNVLVADRIIDPPFELEVLAELSKNSGDLDPCITVMEINCDGLGYKLECRIPDLETRKDISDDERKKIYNEKDELIAFLESCSAYETLNQIRRKKRKDLEYCGVAGMEIIRNQDGTLQQIEHIRGKELRITEKDVEVVPIEKKYILMKNGIPQLKSKILKKKFRRLVQQLSDGTRIWFKEYGDKRDLNCVTGDYGTSENPVPLENKANEILFFDIYDPSEIYGISRYMGTIFSIWGSQSSERINYTTMANNNVPSLIITCINGKFTKNSIDRIQSFMDTTTSEDINMSKVVILEAVPASTTNQLIDPSSPHTRVDIKDVSPAQKDDALFQKYQDGSQNRVRRRYRFSPIFFGDNPDNAGSAEIARKISDEQVFAPERNLFDDIFNSTIVLDFGSIYWKFVSNTPIATDNMEIVKMLAIAERSGGSNPKIARDMLEKVFNKNYPPIDPEKLDPNIPYTLQLAIAAKNTGPINQGTTSKIPVGSTIPKETELEQM